MAAIGRVGVENSGAREAHRLRRAQWVGLSLRSFDPPYAKLPAHYNCFGGLLAPSVLGRPMFAEIISIGSELTSGQNLDTNSQWLSRRLAEIGIPVGYHTTVADDFEANVEVFHTASCRRDRCSRHRRPRTDAG